MVSIAELRRPALVGKRPPGRDVGALARGDQARPQPIGGAQRQRGVALVAGDVEQRDRAAPEDEADVVGVRIVGARRHQHHALLREVEMALVAGPEVGGEMEPDPEAAEPVAVAPGIARVTGGARGGHGAPAAVRRGDVGKLEPDRPLVLDELFGQQVERLAVGALGVRRKALASSRLRVLGPLQDVLGDRDQRAVLVGAPRSRSASGGAAGSTSAMR